MTDMCTPTGGLINPATFPIPTAVPATLERQARELRQEGANVAGIGGDIKSAWAGLSSCYSAPEAETLYAVVDPVATDGDKVETSFDKAASALETFAAAVRDIKGKWSTLETDSYAFLSSIEGDDDWRKADGFVDRLLGRESDKVEEHQALLDRADALRREYEEAERACANAINADIPDRTNFVAGDGDGESAPGEFEHGYDGYLGDVAMPWGGPMETDHGWWIDAGAAVGDFVVGIAEDVGGITGMYSSEGWFEMSWGDAMWEYHEGNLQSLASLAGMYDSENDSWGWSGWGTVGNAWKDAAHAVVPWEEWGDRPGYVIGTALLNIGATVGGAALTATGVGAVVGAPLMAWRGSAMLNRMGGDGPSVPDVDVPDMSRINLSLPRFGNVSLADLRIDLGQLRQGAFSTSRLSEMQNLLSRFAGGNFFGGGDGPGGNGSGGDGNGSEGSNSQRVANHHGDGEGGPADTRPAVHPTTRQLDDSQELMELLASHPDFAELGDTGRRVLGEEGGDSGSPRTNRSGRSDLEELGLDPSLEAVFNDMNARASDYPAWEARQSPDGPDAGRVPALVGGGNNDTFDASRDVPNPPSHDRVDLTGTGGDGPRRLPDDHRDTDLGDDGPQMRDRTPTVTNSTGGNGSDPLDTGGNSRGGTDVLDGSGDGGGNTHSTGGNGRGPGDTRPGSAGGDILGGRNDGPQNTPIRNQPDLRPESTDPRVRELLPRDGLRFGEIRDDNGNVSNRVLEPNSRYRLYEPGSDLHTDYITDADGNIREIRTESKGWNSEHPEYLNPRPDMTFNVDGYTYRTDEYGRTVSVEGTLHKEPNVRNESEQSKVNSQGSDYYEQLNQKIRDDFEAANGRPPEAGEVPQYQDIQWDGGHLIGYAEFFGIGERLNMVPMRFDVNQNRTETALDDIPEEVRGGIEGSYRNIERSWRGIMRDKGSWHGFTNPKFNDGSWDAALALNPNNPKIDVKITNIYDPSLPPVYDKSGNRHLPPPSRIEVEWVLNGVRMENREYNNVPPLVD